MRFLDIYSNLTTTQLVLLSCLETENRFGVCFSISLQNNLGLLFFQRNASWLILMASPNVIKLRGIL
jgi:hypothetical protein